MVSKISLCVVSGLMCSQPTPMSEDIDAQQKHYSEVSEAEVQQLINDVTTPTFVRDFGTLEKIDYLVGYNEYLEEQERLEQQRLEEEQRRLEEEQRRLEQERILEEQRKHQEWLDSFNRKGYRQTYYGSFEGEVSVGAGYSIYSPEIRSIDGVYHFNDTTYGYLPVVAISLQEVLNSGRVPHHGTYNAYGSVIEMKYPDNSVQQAIVLDACGACDRANKIDLWASTPSPNFDIQGIDWKFVRYGW